MNVYATGGWQQPGSYIDMVTTKLSKDGELLWQHVFNNQGDSLVEEGDGIAIDEKYVYSIGGMQADSVNGDMIIFVYDKGTGEVKYQIQLDNLVGELGRNIASYKDGFVFCGGASTQEPQSTILITGYYKLPAIIDAANESIGYTEGQLNISPNPSSGQVWVDLWQGLRNIDELHIVDLSGRCVKSIAYHGQTALQVQLDELPSGTYFLKVGHVMKKFLMVK
jgi:hypothetical protein